MERESKYIPAVLTGHGCKSSISMQRALKQIKQLLENIDDPELEDRVLASLDDIDLMLEQIFHG